MTKILPIIVSIAFVSSVTAQQYKWAKNNGASASLSSSISISVNSLSETWAVPINSSATRYYGAGAGAAPDLGVLNTNQGILRFDANMNLVWSTSATATAVAADPLDPTRFYLVNSFTSASTTVGGFNLTGQPASSTAYVAHCQATGTGGITYLWIAKMDGLLSETIQGLRVRSIGGNHVRIVVQGSTRSATISNYVNGTTAIAQTVSVPGGGGTNYSTYLSYFDDDNNPTIPVVSPLWINTFGTAGNSITSIVPIEIIDNGDVLLAKSYNSNSLGLVNYTLNNSSGAGPGTLTSNNYPANITGGNRFILFRFAALTGTVTASKNELPNSEYVIPRGFTSDAAGNIYVYASLSGSYSPGGLVGPLVSAGGYNAAVIVYDPSFSAVRGARFGSPAGTTTSSVLNPTALDRNANRLYISGYTGGAFSTGTASVQQVSGNDGFLLALDATTLTGISAVSCIGTGVAGSPESFGGVVVRPDGNIVGTQEYNIAAHDRMNAATTPLLPKTAYGYQDVAITRFDGTLATLLSPLQEGGWGATTSNTIRSSGLKGTEMISMGAFSGTMTVGPTTISGSGSFLAATDTASGTINTIKQMSSSQVMKISPVDGSIYLVGTTNGDVTPPSGTALGKVAAGNFDAFIMKLDANYNHLWTAYLGGVENDYAYGVDIDPATNDVYVLGYFISPTLMLNAAGATSYSGSVIATNSNTGTPLSADVYVAKFSGTGTFQWISTGGSPSTAVNDLADAPALQYLNGAVYFGANSTGNVTFSFGGQAVTVGGNTDMILGSLSSSTGSTNWLKTWSGNNGLEALKSITTYGNLLYLGGTSTSTTGLTLGGVNFITGGSYDGFLFAVDQTGAEQPGLFQAKGNNNDYITEIRADAIGNIFFAGTSSSSSLPIAGSTLGTSGAGDCLVGAVDAASLTAKFGFMSGSVNDDAFNTVTPGKVGMLFTGGSLKGSATFGSTVLTGRLGGDFVYARLDYPFIAPGAQVSNINTWFKANAGLTGNPATTWANSSNTNTLLTNVSNTGTVVVNNTALNYNPTISVTSGNFLSQTNTYVPNFLDASGSKYSIYVVLKPTSAADQLQLWNETATNTNVVLGTSANFVSGTGGSKTASQTTALPLGQFSISTLLVNGGTMSNYVNGSLNGSQTGVTAVSTINAGVYKIGGIGSMEVAEMVTYGGAHTAANPPINRIETYLAIKYGITVKHHYFSTVGDTVFKYSGSFINHIAGIAVDSNEWLFQRQGMSQETAAKGNMIAVGIGTIATSNLNNTSPVGKDVSYLVWGDDNGSIATTSHTNLPVNIASCAYRLPRSWKIVRTGTGIGATQVQVSLAGTAGSSTIPEDFVLLIDRDGDGDFTTGKISAAYASSYSSGIVTFDNVNWDTDQNGVDVFALIVNGTAYAPAAALLAPGSWVAAPEAACADNTGFRQFVDVINTPGKKYAAINTNGNTGYSLTVFPSNDSAGTVANQMKTDHLSNTTALVNRMFTVKDGGLGNYSANGGMTVRLFYNPSDSAAAVAALDAAVLTGPNSFSWFKMEGSVADIKAAQTSDGLQRIGNHSVTLLAPARYGTESGLKFVEFDNIQNFSTFGAIAKKGSFTLPISFLYTEATARDCQVTVNWDFATDSELGYGKFQIERSDNGTSFRKIAEMTAKGKQPSQTT